MAGLQKEIGKNITEVAFVEGAKVSFGKEKSPAEDLASDMAEGIVIAAAWFTARMVCQVSYRAIKSYREKKQLKADGCATTAVGPQSGDLQAVEVPGPGYEKQKDGVPVAHATPAFNPHGGGQVNHGGPTWGQATEVRPGQATEVMQGVKNQHVGPPVVCDESTIPWAQGHGKPYDDTHSSYNQQQTLSLAEEDREWLQELTRATEGNRRDNVMLLEEIRGLGDKIDNIAIEALYDKLRLSMKLLLEYQQNPRYRTAMDVLNQAECAAREVYTNEKSLALNLSALRIRVIITYLHCPKHSLGELPNMDDKEDDKRQCELYINNALRQYPLEDLCNRFVKACDSSDDRRLPTSIECEAMLAFDIILEVIMSVYVLEPYRPSESPLPKGAPDKVMHALSVYCSRKMGSSSLYVELAEAFSNWQFSPDKQEKLALQALYTSTNGGDWACSEGWDKLFDGNMSSLYGISTENGRVTKISLGANNLCGTIPKDIHKLVQLQELSLPGNKLHGKLPELLWSLPHLRVVSLHGNRFIGVPPPRFSPATDGPSAANSSRLSGMMPGIGRSFPTRSRMSLAGTVEACHPERLSVYGGEWFPCSWKVTNTGGIEFPRTKLCRGYDDDLSDIRGATEVFVNPLRPGEQQTVTVMQQAPKYGLNYQDKWVLVGEGGLDFIDGPSSRTPLIKLGQRHSSAQEGGGGHGPTLADTVFVSTGRGHRRPSHRSNTSDPSAAPGPPAPPRSSGPPPPPRSTGPPPPPRQPGQSSYFRMPHSGTAASYSGPAKDPPPPTYAQHQHHSVYHRR